MSLGTKKLPDRRECILGSHLQPRRQSTWRRNLIHGVGLFVALVAPCHRVDAYLEPLVSPVDLPTAEQAGGEV